MVGRSGVTLYDVTTVKRHVVTHVAVNGGMGDNLEPMLYGTVFTPRILDANGPTRSATSSAATARAATCSCAAPRWPRRRSATRC
jgi:diaminopimelate decarboxylase